MAEHEPQRHRRRADEVERQQGVERREPLGGRQLRDRRGQVRLERLAGDRCGLEQRVLVRRHGGELLGQQRCDRGGHTRCAAVRAGAAEHARKPSFGARARELLDVERIAAAMADDRRRGMPDRSRRATRPRAPRPAARARSGAPTAPPAPASIASRPSPAGTRARTAPRHPRRAEAAPRAARSMLRRTSAGRRAAAPAAAGVRVAPAARAPHGARGSARRRSAGERPRRPPAARGGSRPARPPPLSLRRIPETRRTRPARPPRR